MSHRSFGKAMAKQGMHREANLVTWFLFLLISKFGLCYGFVG
jgi:hypothetical protein